MGGTCDGDLLRHPQKNDVAIREKMKVCEMAEGSCTVGDISSGRLLGVSGGVERARTAGDCMRSRHREMARRRSRSSQRSILRRPSGIDRPVMSMRSRLWAWLRLVHMRM